MSFHHWHCENRQHVDIFVYYIDFFLKVQFVLNFVLSFKPVSYSQLNLHTLNPTLMHAVLLFYVVFCLLKIHQMYLHLAHEINRNSESSHTLDSPSSSQMCLTLNLSCYPPGKIVQFSKGRENNNSLANRM